MSTFVGIIQRLGPGIIAASSAIGTSHLVQSTRAGGYYSFELLWVVILINILKYPFIENGFRYTGGTGENLLRGYYRLNPYYLIAFLIVNLVVTTGSIALLLYVTSGICKAVLGLQAEVNQIALATMLITGTLVIFESYEVFDNLMKVFMCLLLCSTVVATFMAISYYQPVESQLIYQTSAWSRSQLPFVIALMGWMPGPLEMGAWYSLWLEDKNKGKHRLNFQEAKFDFNVGYVLMIVTAVLFTTLGALVLHYSGEPISKNAAIFAGQLISVYTRTIGSWSSPLIGTVMLTTIVSTTITLIDSYPRSISVSLQILNQKSDAFEHKQRKLITLICCLIAYGIIEFLVRDLLSIADIVTTSSFLCAPLFAYLNYSVVTSKLLAKQYHPPWYLRLLSLAGFVFMIGFAAVFIAIKFF